MSHRASKLARKIQENEIARTALKIIAEQDTGDLHAYYVAEKALEDMDKVKREAIEAMDNVK